MITQKDFEDSLGIHIAPKDGRWMMRTTPATDTTTYYLGGDAVATWSKGEGKIISEAWKTTPPGGLTVKEIKQLPRTWANDAAGDERDVGNNS